ncbi:molybdate ABC transporter permease subunit [Sandarakinorhabdus sp. DWP1-3-1]|uniref:molybdate ABC transporter permease subunit n=1 Tax=Sandarakinorhabdus sp. DWP1-3-1 TaxID=2804627 RepID=UPI003CF42982
MAALTPAETQAILVSLRVAGAATLCTVPLAFVLAFVLARRRFAGKALVDALVNLPLVLPPVVTGYLLLIAFGRDGPLGQALAGIGVSVLFRWTGAAIAAGVMALPLMVSPMRLALEAMDRRLEAAAATLGASRTRVFATITLPLVLPGIIAGTVLGFAKALGEFGATAIFVSAIPGETETLPLAINAFLQVPGREGSALRLVVLSIVIAFAALVAAQWWQRRALRHRL